MSKFCNINVGKIYRIIARSIAMKKLESIQNKYLK